MKKKDLLIKIGASLAYLGMIVVNFLANSLPLNNRSTGDISDAYPNLFAPAGLTFSIWGLIYLSLAVYLIYQFGLFGKKLIQNKEDFLRKINFLFIVTSIANISWIFAWHYDLIGLSVIIMVVLLISLIKIVDILRDEKMVSPEKLFISTPFSLYFGWITVATIANITVFLVSVSWNGFGIQDFAWASIILLVGALIGIVRMLKDKNIVFGLVLVWAYSGILLKHVSASGFNQQYPTVIITVAVCLILFLLFLFRLILKKI